MDEIQQLKNEIAEIKKRNARVEADKAWETSLFRKILIAVLTYIVIVIFFFFAKLSKPFVNAIVPTVGFMLSTLSVPIFKKFWLKGQKKRIINIMGVQITYFVHGTTTDNEKGIATGCNQGELSEAGIKQSKELGKKIAGRNFDAIFCSNLKRAVDSAQLVFGGKYKITQNEKLREVNYGDWNGKKNTFKDKLEKFIGRPFPNGESYQDVEKRMREFILSVSQSYNNMHVAIVAHQAPQLALEVIANQKTWKEAIDQDWRKKNKWQPGWEYKID